MELLNRRREMGSHLPYDYEVEYLENTSNSYIETDVAFAAGDIPSARIRCSLISRNTSFGSAPYGGYKHSSSATVQCSFYILFYFNYTRLSIDNINLQFQQPPTLNTIYDIVLNDSNGSFINGQQLDSNVYQLSESLNSLPLFTSKPYNYGKDLEIFKGRIYHFQLLVNGIMRRNFIPVVKDNIGYMYDKVSKQLFGNAGTGQFIVGPRINSAAIITQQQQHEMYG